MIRKNKNIFTTKRATNGSFFYASKLGEEPLESTKLSELAKQK